MGIGHAVILGVIQGLTEFLPVSSSGHLLLGSLALGLPVPGVSLSVLLHLGTAASTVVMLRREIGWILSGIVGGPEARRKRALTLVLCFVLASLPAALVGFFLGDLLDQVFGSGGVAALGLIATGFVLWSTRRPRGVRQLGGRPKRDKAKPAPTLGTVTVKSAVMVGLAQALAAVPGLSRSGSTMAAGLHLKMSREDSFHFSFLLALPVILGGALLDFGHAAKAGIPIFSVEGLIGALVAFVVGLFAFGAVFRVVKKGDLSRFAYYCWAVGVGFLVWLLVTV